MMDTESRQVIESYKIIADVFWWRHAMETYPHFWAFVQDPPVPGGYPSLMASNAEL